jgi:tRNA pseudouridine38-40 synthase
MPRYRFTVEYLGSAFAGWQIQPDAKSVQGVLESALGTALRGRFTVVGAGRTDAGVHARGQVAHVDLPEGVDTRSLQRSLNALCGGELAVRGLEACADTFHARYSALARRYCYRISRRASPLHAATAWWPKRKLDVQALRHELPAALGEHDFVAFSIPRHDGKSTHCHVTRFEMNFDSAVSGAIHHAGREDLLCLHIEANRFLHRMVRALVGAAVEVAAGGAEPGLIARVLAGQGGNAKTEKPLRWTWAPPQGLCLEKVTYADYDADCDADGVVDGEGGSDAEQAD